MKIKGNTYQDRVISQGLLWVNSISIHNHRDGECCPDFSCCQPNMFEVDQAVRERMYQRSLERKNITIQSGKEVNK